MLKAFTVSLLALLSLGALPAAAKLVDGVAAVVDGHVITRSEVDEMVTERHLVDGNAAKADDSRKMALEALIERRLIREEADRLGIRVTDEDLEKAVSEIRERNGMDEETFRKALAAQGMDYSQYLEEVRAQILRVKVASRVLRSRLTVSDEALREYYLKHVADFSKPDQVRLSHIELSGDRQAAEAIRAKVVAGKEQQVLQRGSDMGFLSLDSLSDAVRKAIRGLSPGEVSPVVEIAGGCHLFVLEEVKKGRIPPYEEVKDLVRERYYKDEEKQLYRTWIDALKQKARIERQL